MKNKIKLIVVLSLVTIVAVLFSGCFLSNFNRVKSISLVGTPKTTYYVDEDFDATGLKIQINYVNENQAPVLKDITDADFNIDFKKGKVGTYVCTITLKENANVSLYFDYSVVERGGAFTEGDGSQSSPYVVYTADQFSHIGDMAGQYYVLGDNVDLTKATPNGDGAYNANYKSFVLDGQNYTMTIGGNEKYAFQALSNATIKNLVFNIKPGSRETLLALDIYGSEVNFENITLNGSMTAEQNDGLLAARMFAGNVTVKNCISNVSMSGEGSYYGVFFGLATSNVKNITFEKCINNGNLEGTTAWLFIGNCAHKVTNQINVIDCVNNGKFVGASVGLFNCSGTETVGKRIAKEDYATTELYKKLNKLEVSGSSANYVAISSLLTSGKYDVTLVNDTGTVKFSSAAIEKLNAEFGEGNYTVNAYVRDWVKWQAEGTADQATIYVFTDNFGMDFAAPYMIVKDGTEISSNVNGAIRLENNELVLAGTYKDLVYKTQNSGKYQYYCYHVYDANGAMKYCGQIAYADVQNA
ncbi:MAG: bacterial Ig-like domain-containing protein [Candidatus Borkfalkiaceae bacterium]|nr:bacterial Ig-like domain-containing protein [Christensenellaceae bacterium]